MTQDQAATAAPTASHGGGFLSKLRGSAEAALAKVPAYNELEHAVRQASVQANPRQSPHTVKIQLAVKALKGVEIDAQASGRELKSYSKNILDLARLENTAPETDIADIQDVGDRLAFLTYKQGELHAEYAKKLEDARLCLKEVRNYENSLSTQRDRRVQLENQIGKLRVQSKPDTHTPDRITDLEEDLKAHAGPGTPLAAAEAKCNSMRRQKLAESFKIQFEALQELGEKLSIISGYGRVLLDGWSVSDNAGKTDYVDGERTAAVRTGVENALNGWSANKAYVPLPALNVGHRSSAPSFHDSHSAELASIPAETDPLAAHNEALDSYYRRPDSPTAPGGSTSGTGHTSSMQPPLPPRHASGQSTTSSTGTAPISIPGAFGGSGQPGHTTTGANPFAEQINTAPISDLPAPSSGSTAGGMHTSSSPNLPTSPVSSSLAPASSLPTVAETGAPITGTGGPSSGVLRPPANPAGGDSNDGMGARQGSRKQEEAREELQKRFEQYSNGGQGSGADLERDLSLRGRAGGESLPAYAPEGGAGTSGGKLN